MVCIVLKNLWKMVDSSEDEDLSRFKEVVDCSFIKLLNGTEDKNIKKEHKPKSERYLEESSHYNDVKVPEKLQNQIGTKISTILNKCIEFVDVEQPEIKNSKIKGGVKLFNTSQGFLSCEEIKDVYTELHNNEAKKILTTRRRHINEDQNLNENDKISAVVVSGEHILSQDDTKMWKSRRKEKLFKYKSQGKGEVLVAVD